MLTAGRWVDMGKAGRVYKGYWPLAGETLIFEGGRSVTVVDSQRGAAYTLGDGSICATFPPTDKEGKKLGKLVSVVRPHAEIVEMRPDEGSVQRG